VTPMESDGSVGDEYLQDDEPVEDDLPEDAAATEADGVFLFRVPPTCQGWRIDRTLRALTGESRNRIQQILSDGGVRVDGRVVETSSRRVTPGQQVELRVPPPIASDLEPEPLDLVIVHEDEDVLVVDKPRGMVVHPAPGHRTGTLAAGVLHHVPELAGIGGVRRPGIVHRIDKDTTGLLVVAKNANAHAQLAKQFKAHTITRRYLAIVHGSFAHERATIDAPLARDPLNRVRMAVVPEGTGRDAITHVQTIERFPAFTYVQLVLETGRTHQIRVHMAHIGHPVAGDPVYARRNPLGLAGQALHAAVLGFVHPRTGSYMEFRAELPSDFADALDTLRRM
jgi:23S rRNA pseudouridine1911/1915/1917 synthase